MLRIGYIGLGIMGKPMAKNILKAGFPIIVHNRSRSAVNELAELGAQTANTPKEVAEKSDIVFTNLPDSPDVETVVLGENGIIHGAHAGMIFVDNSTIKPFTARKIALLLESKDVQCLDAPVSGGDIGAIKGTLAIMVGGPKEALEKARPVLEALGKTITYVGESGAGQIAKACNQIMVSAQMVAMGELLVFAQKAGADPERVIAAIQNGAAQCWTLDNKPKRLFAGNRNPGFKASLQAKDLNIVMESSREYGVPVPLSAITTQMFQSMLQMGMADLDNSAVVGVFEKLASQELKTIK